MGVSVQRPSNVLSKKDALNMISGTGDKRRTHYNCATVDAAREAGVGLLIWRKRKEVVVPARRVHRDITAVYGEHHEYADEGKYIDLEAYTDETHKVIKGAQFVNPFLYGDRCNRSIVEMFQRAAGQKVLARLTADLKQDREMGEHAVWRGARNFDGFVASTPWFTKPQLWDLVRKENSGLESFLRKSKSPQKDAKKFATAREKFFTNIDVLQRATVIVHCSTGVREFTGGVTPYAHPLMGMGMAIDSRYMTMGYDVDGEIVDCCYRMVWGRPEPRPLLLHGRLIDGEPSGGWVYEDQSSKYIYPTDAVAKRCQRAATKFAKSAA